MREVRRLILRAIDELDENPDDIDAVIFILEDALAEMPKRREIRRVDRRPMSKRKVKRSPKAKLVDKMTKPIWDKYKKGRGKKTYVQIRAQVSRSQKYKRAVKRL